MTAAEPTQPSGATATGREISLPAVRDLFYGAGSLERAASRIGAGGERVFVVASPFSGEAVERVAGLLGGAYAGAFDEVAMHVARDSVDAALEAARSAGAQTLVSIGGGTEIDCTKAVALCLGRGLGSTAELAGYRLTMGGAARPVGESAAEIPAHVSMPTTLSGAEATSLFGITDPQTSEKQVFSDPGVAPRAVVLDPWVAGGTPDWLWGSSGMRAVDHAVEGILSPRGWPLQEANALEGLRFLNRNLVHSSHNPGDEAARTACQLGAWMTTFAIETTGVGLSHAIGHQLAPRFGLAHGVTSAIMLPHVMAFNAETTGPGLARIAAALGCDADGAAEGVRSLAAGLRSAGVTTTLSEAGADWEGLGAVADHVMADPSIATNPRPVNREDVMALFEAAWA